MRPHCLIVVLLIVIVKCFASQLKQEGATINYCNPKYVSDCHAITRRIRRGEPYRTNLTANFKYAFGNNVTLKTVLLGGIKVELVKTRLCDIQNIDWLFEYIKKFAQIEVKCPYKQGIYGIYNMEFPPKNLPLRMDLLNGNFHSKFYLLVTKTEEIIVESTVIFSTMQ